MFTSAERIQERGQKTRGPEEFSSMLQVQWQIFIFISGEQLTAIIMKLLQLITYTKTIVFWIIRHRNEALSIWKLKHLDTEI